MRVLLEVQIPNETFNAYVKDGTVAGKMGRILEECHPEAAYFYDVNGCRGGTVVCNINDQSELPKIAEPWFLTFGAKVTCHICMTPEDLGKSDFKELGQKWC
jgi:hypothetical protein